MSQPTVEPSHVGGAHDKAPRTVSRAVFECLSWGMFVVIIFAEIALVATASEVVGVRLFDRHLFAGMGYANFFLSRLAVDRLLRLAGWSRSGKTVEVRGRTAAFATYADDDDAERVEARIQPSFIKAGFWSALLLFLVFGLILTFSPSRETGEAVACYFMLAFSGLVGGCCLYACRWGRPQAWADASGITAYPFERGALRRRFVPWASVATCEIETFFDTFGSPVLIRPVLKGGDGATLMTLDLRYTRRDDQERLAEFIKARLPKPKPAIEAWDW